MLRFSVGVLIILGVGVMLGWSLRGAQQVAPPAPVAATRTLEQVYLGGDIEAVVRLSGGDESIIDSLVGVGDTPYAVEVIEAFAATHGASLNLNLRAAEMLRTTGDYARAMEWIKLADLHAVDPDQHEAVGDSLRRATQAFAMELIANKQFDAVDELYEGITFAMPERADYFLKLGSLRIQVGRYDEALAPLSQIQNRSDVLGNQARDLIAQLDRNDVSAAAQFEEFPLGRSGNQFMVQAQIDRRHAISLLVDTGAAMTVIDRPVVEAMGYGLNGRPTELFATANGVVDAPVVTLAEFAVGGSAMTYMAIGALPLDLPNGVDGLLGMNFLRHYEFRIDQDRSVLQLKAR